MLRHGANDCTALHVSHTHTQLTAHPSPDDTSPQSTAGQLSLLHLQPSRRTVPYFEVLYFGSARLAFLSFGYTACVVRNVVRPWEWPKIDPSLGVVGRYPGQTELPCRLARCLSTTLPGGPLRPGSCRPRDAPDSGLMRWKMGSTLLFLAEWDIFPSRIGPHSISRRLGQRRKYPR
jgi:hypothetical protein